MILFLEESLAKGPSPVKKQRIKLGQRKVWPFATQGCQELIFKLLEWAV